MEKKRGLIVIGLVLLMIAIVYGASFVNNDKAGFDAGVYDKTFYNTSINVIQLNISQGFLAGNYTSSIFDAGSIANWSSLGWGGNLSTKEYLYATDDNADVWKSIDYGVTWILAKDDYTGAEANGAKASFFNSSGSYFVIFNQQVWVSSDMGITWIKRSDDYNGAEGQNADAANVDKNDYLYIIEGDQDVYQSTNSGSTWTKLASNFNGGNGVVAGLVVNSSNTLISVDDASDVWKSNNGITWTLLKDDLNGAQGNNANALAIDKNNVLYVLDAQEVWKSSDSGASWTKQTSDFDASDAHLGFSIATDSNNNVFIIDGGEDVYKSTDSGVSWTKLASNFNAGNGNARAFSTILKNSNLTFQVKNCSLADCSDGTWQNVNLNNINLRGRYFQYKAEFTTPDSSITPTLKNVTLNYNLLNTAPIISIVHPQAKIYNYKNNMPLNYSVFDANLDSCWYNLNNGANTTLANCNNITFNVASDGTYTITIFANDTFGLKTSDSLSFSVDSILPDIAIASPQNISYNINSILVHFAYIENNKDSVWWYNGTNNVTFEWWASPSNYNFAEGTHILIVYANDTAGNLNQTNVTFYVDTISPSLNLVHPEAKIYGYDTNLPLNFTISDPGLQTCWYNLNNGTNNTLGNCANTTFNVASDGNYVVYLFANDSLNSVSSDAVEFSVLTTAPAINLVYPNNGSYINYAKNVYFNYTVGSGIGLSVCQLWGDFSGNFILNQTDTSPIINNGGSHFILNLSDRSYYWGIVCNDTQNRFSNVNRSFVIDATAPNLSMSQPSGTKTSRTGIALSFSLVDANINSCFYNLTRWDGALWASYRGNTVINCSLVSTSFSVADDGNYQLYLIAQDLAGNSNFTNSSFSVDTSSQPPGGGGTPAGGGASAAGGGGLLEGKLKISGLENILMKPGETKTLAVNIENVGKKFLNKCRLIGGGEASGWISGSSMGGLAIGETTDVVFSVSAPSDATGEVGATVLIQCNETTGEGDFIISILSSGLNAEINNIEQIGKRLEFSYFITNGEEESFNVQVEYWLAEENEKKITGQDSFVIGAGQRLEKKAGLDISTLVAGDYRLVIRVITEKDSVTLQEDVLISQGGLTGLVILGQDAGTLISIIIMVGIGLVIAFFIVRNIIRKVGRRDRVHHIRQKLNKRYK